MSINYLLRKKGQGTALHISHCPDEFLKDGKKQNHPSLSKKIVFVD